MDTTILLILIVAAAGWIGEAITLNLIIVPSLRPMDREDQARFIGRYFPRFFRLATYLALIAVAASIAVVVRGSVPAPSQTLFVIGSAVIWTLALFHLAIESRLRPIARSLLDSPDEDKTRIFVAFLRIVPRIGILVLLCGFVLIVKSIL
jgi:hypothetical protein